MHHLFRTSRFVMLVVLALAASACGVLIDNSPPSASFVAANSDEASNEERVTLRASDPESGVVYLAVYATVEGERRLLEDQVLDPNVAQTPGAPSGDEGAEGEQPAAPAGGVVPRSTELTVAVPAGASRLEGLVRNGAGAEVTASHEVALPEALSVSILGASPLSGGAVAADTALDVEVLVSSGAVLERVTLQLQVEDGEARTVAYQEVGEPVFSGSLSIPASAVASGDVGSTVLLTVTARDALGRSDSATLGVLPIVASADVTQPVDYGEITVGAVTVAPSASGVLGREAWTVSFNASSGANLTRLELFHALNGESFERIAVRDGAAGTSTTDEFSVDGAGPLYEVGDEVRFRVMVHDEQKRSAERTAGPFTIVSEDETTDSIAPLEVAAVTVSLRPGC